MPAIEKATGLQVAEVGRDHLIVSLQLSAKNTSQVFFNEGNSVTNAKEMEKAILSHVGLSGIRVAVLDHLGETEITGPQEKISGISKVNNFRFSPGGVKVWQAFDIGPGKVTFG